jgi:uncharacterized protein YdhG (YjbR/CyaY superfamily)/predicted GNAT family acetyltransferase
VASTKNIINEYISSFPKETQMQLQTLRNIIINAAPDAEEVFSYAMPTYKLHGNLVHFAGYKNHIGFYPAPSGISNFEKELATYKTSKGAIQIPISDKIPKGLIEEIVRFRITENKTKFEAKKLKILHENSKSKGKFYIKKGKILVAEMTYVWAGETRIIIDHTEVDESLKGQGVGKKLLAEAVNFARHKGIKIMPLCPFAQAIFDKEKDFKDVLF